MRQRIFEGVATAILLAILTAAIQTYIEVRLLRVEVDRLNVYVDQLWTQK